MLQTKTVEELRRNFSELNVALRQIGVDDEKPFMEERIIIGDRLLQKDVISYVLQYCKRGLPNGSRCAVYMKILGITIGEKVRHYEE